MAPCLPAAAGLRPSRWFPTLAVFTVRHARRWCGWPTCTWRAPRTAPTTASASSGTRCSGWRATWAGGKVRGAQGLHAVRAGAWLLLPPCMLLNGAACGRLSKMRGTSWRPPLDMRPGPSRARLPTPHLLCACVCCSGGGGGRRHPGRLQLCGAGLALLAAAAGAAGAQPHRRVLPAGARRWGLVARLPGGSASPGLPLRPAGLISRQGGETPANVRGCPCRSCPSPAAGPHHQGDDSAPLCAARGVRGGGAPPALHAQGEPGCRSALRGAPAGRGAAGPSRARFVRLPGCAGQRVSGSAWAGCRRLCAAGLDTGSGQRCLRALAAWPPGSGSPGSPHRALAAAALNPQVGRGHAAPEFTW